MFSAGRRSGSPSDGGSALAGHLQRSQRAGGEHRGFEYFYVAKVVHEFSYMQRDGRTGETVASPVPLCRQHRRPHTRVHARWISRCRDQQKAGGRSADRAASCPADDGRNGEPESLRIRADPLSHRCHVRASPKYPRCSTPRFAQHNKRYGALVSDTRTDELQEAGPVHKTPVLNVSPVTFTAV